MIRIFSILCGVGFVLGLAASVQAAGGDKLLDLLDLARPELSAVKTAYDKGDIPAARTAFAKYLRERKNPIWKIDPDNPSKAITRAEMKEADAAMAHKIYSYVFRGFGWQYGERIDWKFDPTSLPDSPVAYTPEWTWSANRHRTWVAMAKAYTATGDPKYGKEVSKQLQEWIQDNPPEEPTGAERKGMLWRGIEGGIRMAHTWPEVYYRLIHHPDVFPDDVLLDMVYSMREHAENLDGRTHFMVRGNHLAIECYGYYTVGVLFPEFKDAARWRTTAANRERDEIDFEIYPDGAQIELAPGYHIFSLNSFTGIVELAQWNHYTLPAGFKSELEKMYNATMWQIAPDRTHPPFNDADAGPSLPTLKQGLEQFPNHPDWKWLVSDGSEGHQPAEVSHLFPYAGWPVMRSSWDRDARYLLMECGPYGMAHQHQDKLSFILHAYGATLVSEGGAYTYDASEMRKYVISARAHNVIHIDGLEQNQPRQSREYYSKLGPTDVNWRSTPEYDFAQGSYGTNEIESWGENHINGFVHTRRVLFVKPDYWVIMDTVTPPDDQEHTYESTFHLAADKVDVDSTTKTVRTLNDGPNLTILPVASQDLSVRIITAQKKPFYQGWILSPEDDQMLPSATPYYTIKCKGPAQFMYVFSPSKPGEQGPIKAIAKADISGAINAGEITLADGSKAKVALLKDGGVSFDPLHGKPLHIDPLTSKTAQ